MGDLTQETGRDDGRHDERAALLALDRLPGVGPRTVHKILSRFGSGRAAMAARAPAFAAVAGREAAHARRVEIDTGASVRLLDRALETGMRVVAFGDADYPRRLEALADPPVLLFFRGRTTLLDAGGVAIVGLRRAPARARESARALGFALARRGVTVVSGLALGVDGAAHVGALEGGGPTTAVLGTGADVPYPRSHTRLFHRIAEHGLLVSEFAPGTRAAPWHFPRRNRVIAALADDVVVVAAGARSGALITVDHALDLGRDVWTVPGPIDGPGYRGSNRLLQDGAHPLVSIDAFADRFGPPVPSSAPPRSTGLDGEARVLDVLADGDAPLDDVAARVGLPLPAVLHLLTSLELAGVVERLPGARFRRAA
ncbi:MAG: DNA-processing protein DprA [Gemmatimonadota bacterium]